MNKISLSLSEFWHGMGYYFFREETRVYAQVEEKVEHVSHWFLWYRWDTGTVIFHKHVETVGTLDVYAMNFLSVICLTFATVSEGISTVTEFLQLNS